MARKCIRAPREGRRENEGACEHANCDTSNHRVLSPAEGPPSYRVVGEGVAAGDDAGAGASVGAAVGRGVGGRVGLPLGNGFGRAGWGV